MTVVRYFLLLMISFVFDSTSDAHRGYYTTKTPYRPSSKASVLPSPPPDFDLVCAQIVARHGCRTVDGQRYDNLTMALLAQAKEEGALTEFGQRLEEDVRNFTFVNDKSKRSQLSELGRIEHQGLAHRLTERLLPLFLKIFISDTPNGIRLVSGGKSRMIESLHAFVEGLPPILKSSIEYEPPNRTLLFFNKNSRQQAYYADKRLVSKLQSIETQPYSKQIARRVLERLYTPSFIDRLANEMYYYFDSESGDSIQNELDAARMLHGLYLICPCLREEGIGDLFEKYFHHDESLWLAYIYDAKDYYKKGPGFADRTVSYDRAQILLDDFFLHTEKCSQINSKYFLRTRFTHSKAIIPFVSLLKIPFLSDKSTPFNETYTYENNDWRTEIVSPMTANIQWEIYRHINYGKNRYNRRQQILVRMLLNEYPVPFKLECKSYSINYPFFYTIDELKRCYK